MVMSYKGGKKKEKRELRSEQPAEQGGENVIFFFPTC